MTNESIKNIFFGAGENAFWRSFSNIKVPPVEEPAIEIFVNPFETKALYSSTIGFAQSSHFDSLNSSKDKP